MFAAVLQTAPAPGPAPKASKYNPSQLHRSPQWVYAGAITTSGGFDMDLGSINWLAVVASAVSAFVLGGIWYGPIFGKAWQRLEGISDEQMQGGHMPMIFGGALVLNLVMATSLALLLQLHPAPALISGFAAGGLLGLGFIASAYGISYLFGRKPLALWLIDAGYMVVFMALMGAILGAWR